VLYENILNKNVPPSTDVSMTTLDHNSNIWDPNWSVSFSIDYNDNIKTECKCEIGYRSDTGSAPCEACPAHSVSGNTMSSYDRLWYFNPDMSGYHRYVSYGTGGTAACRCDIGYVGVNGYPPCEECPENSYPWIPNYGGVPGWYQSRYDLTCIYAQINSYYTHIYL
jgi:hypothetical protein